jgi:energy-coupling factor transporter transmembrane protein EcfT
VITFSPTAKILLYIFLIITVFFSNSFRTDVGILVIVFIFTFGIPVSVFTRGLIPITLFLAFTFFSNILFQSGRIIYEIWGIAVTEEGLKRGGHLTLRLFILILGAKALTATTRAEELVGAMNVLLGPLGRWGPLREFMSTMSLTLRFLPIIYDEAQSLYAETVKNSPETTFLNKVKLSVSLLTPLFERSLKRAKNLKSE